jgi:LemA protein
MGALSIGLIVVLAVVALVVFIVFLAGIGTYNGLVGKRVETENAWSQIDVQLKRRYDLIPNLVETVKGYAGHEKETLERVVQARSAALKAQSPDQVAQAESQLTGALRGLFAVVESYPDLKANQNFLDLQEELKGTENRIGFARQYYNDSVAKYNSSLQTFPTNVFAGLFGFRQVEFFHLDDAERAAVRSGPPQVKF